MKRKVHPLAVAVATKLQKVPGPKENRKQEQQEEDNDEAKGEENTTEYSGEHKCESMNKHGILPCGKKAYFRVGKRLACGRHSTKQKDIRVKLKKNPNQKGIRQEFYEKRKREIDAVAQANKAAGVPGTLSLQKMKMMKDPIYTHGIQLVFPNNRHGNRPDGMGKTIVNFIYFWFRL